MIYQINYQGYNAKGRHYAKCVLTVRKDYFSLAQICKIASLETYPVCSAIEIFELSRTGCMNHGGTIWNDYQEAERDGYALSCYTHQVIDARRYFSIPRFSEPDFVNLFEQNGGCKLTESEAQTPDFLLDGIIMELKDLQQESLRNPERQKNIGKVFENVAARTIDLNPSADYGEAAKNYHGLIRNSLRNTVKSASRQLKSYGARYPVKASGMIFMNTGLFSLPHELFKGMLIEILEKHTRTIQFMLLFSQTTQSNGNDTYAIFPSALIGRVPDAVQLLQPALEKMVEQKMTQTITGPPHASVLADLEPISFFESGKLFYWNPGPLPDSRLNL